MEWVVYLLSIHENLSRVLLGYDHPIDYFDIDYGHSSQLRGCKISKGATL